MSRHYAPANTYEHTHTQMHRESGKTYRKRPIKSTTFQTDRHQSYQARDDVANPTKTTTSFNPFTAMMSLENDQLKYKMWNT